MNTDAIAARLPLDQQTQTHYLLGYARALCNGKTLAFQAKDTGSIPVARSIAISNLCAIRTGKEACPTFARLPP